MSNWPNGKLIKCPVDEIAVLIKCLVDEMADW